MLPRFAMKTSCSIIRSVGITHPLRPPCLRSPSPSPSSSSLSWSVHSGPSSLLRLSTCISFASPSVQVRNSIIGDGRQKSTSAQASLSSSSPHFQAHASPWLPLRLAHVALLPSPRSRTSTRDTFLPKSSFASSFFSLINPFGGGLINPSAPSNLLVCTSRRLRKSGVGISRAELDEDVAASPFGALRFPIASATTRCDGVGDGGVEAVLQRSEVTSSAVEISSQGKGLMGCESRESSAMAVDEEEQEKVSTTSSSRGGDEITLSAAVQSDSEGLSSVYLKGSSEARVVPLLSDEESMVKKARLIVEATETFKDEAMEYKEEGGEGRSWSSSSSSTSSSGGQSMSAADDGVLLPIFDPHRPAYHLQPPNSWMNDPNGPIYINGLYHLFYQHNPSKAAWDWGICWGHAVSTDLVHWEHRPLALTPTPGTYDEDGIFSGCCVNNEGVPTILYTGVQTTKRGGAGKVTSYNEVQGIGFSEVQCIATFGADGKIQKHAANPVINSPPPGLEIVGFRDPFVWREDKDWFMLVGSGIQDVGGTALLYKSPDLIRWEYVQPICMGNVTESGAMWECPLLVNFGKWHMLCVSPDNPANPVLYWVGVFEKGSFTPRGGVKRLDLGNVVYAPNCCVDSHGRQLLWGWVQEVRTEEASVTAGYAGCLTLPRVLSMTDDGVLVQEPPVEMKLLRGCQLVNEGAMRLAPVDPMFYGVRTGCLEIEVEVDRGTADAFGIDIREMPTIPQPMPAVVSRVLSADDATAASSSPHLEATRAQKVLNAEPHEGVLISYDFNRKWLEVSWWQPGPEQGTEDTGELVSKGGEVALREGESLKMRVFLDRSVVEVFVNGLACLTTRMYRAVIGVALLAKGGDANLVSANMWEMGSMWDVPAAAAAANPALP